MRTLDRLLNPRSIAIVGLSADPTKHGNRVLRNLQRLDFGGDIWGVNPKTPSVNGVSTFASLSDLPSHPDVVVSAVPASFVPAVAREAASMGAVAIIVFAGGFAESGGSGIKLEAELNAIVQDTGIRILGPNSGGVIVPTFGTAMSFLTCLDRPAQEIRSGPVGLVTQSGGMGSYVHNLAAAKKSGLAASISTGNEADLGIADGITLLAKLAEVRSIAVILETVRDGPAFIRAVRYAREHQKQVVVFRIGTSELGQRLMRTHTGALAHPNRVFDGVLDSLGVKVAETPEELLEIAELVALTPLPKGPRVGIVTHSGGVAIMLSDLARSTRIEFPKPSATLSESLSHFLQQGSIDNPLDMGAIIGGPHRFAQAVDAFSQSGEVDLVLAVSSAHPPAHSSGRVESLLELESPVPVVHLWMAGDVAEQGLSELRHAGAPTTEEPRAAIKAVAALARAATYVEPVLKAAQDQTELGQLNEFAAKEVLRGWGFSVVEGSIAKDSESACGIASKLGYPVVVKVSSKEVSHKTELGGVVLDLNDTKSVERAFNEVTASAQAVDVRIDGVLVEKQVAGPEVIIGAIRDAIFGPMVLVGLGGTAAEALDDVQMGLAPLTFDHAGEMIVRLKGIGLLTHPRVGKSADLDKLAAMLILLAERIASNETLDTIDLNPVIWSGSDWVLVDALIQSSSISS